MTQTYRRYGMAMKMILPLRDIPFQYLLDRGWTMGRLYPVPPKHDLRDAPEPLDTSAWISGAAIRNSMESANSYLNELIFGRLARTEES